MIVLYRYIYLIAITIYMTIVNNIISIPGQIGINFPVENESTYTVTIEVNRHGDNEVLWGHVTKDIESVNSNGSIIIPIVSETNTKGAGIGNITFDEFLYTIPSQNILIMKLTIDDQDPDSDFYK